MLGNNLVRITIAFTVACGLSWHGLKKRSLNMSGAIAAFLVGFLSFGVSYRFGIILILFYYTSSKLTKVNEARKAELESHYQQGGQRNAIQVFANSLLATAVAVIYYIYIGDDEHEHANSHVIDLPYLNITVTREFLLFQLWCSYISHYACAAADTWASEVGILADGQPRLVTSLFLRSVPPGTNGGMSALGTAASVAGGLFIGLIFYVASFALPSSPQISQLPMVWLGGVCGVLGSFFDSILGATVQATYYSKDRKCIVKKSDPEFKTDLSICLISGMDVLTNEEVNFVSILLTMLCSFPIGSLLYCVSTKCIEY